MKKLFVSLTIVILLAVLAVACKSGERCSAYGEKQRYQIERTH